MEKNNILVSIIIPIYNVEKYITKCIDSIIKQDYKNLEIILVNDGSKDNSLKICEKYKKMDNRIVLINKENGGVSSARNEGLKIAKGEYISFVDGDDFLEPDFVSYMLNIIIKYNCDIAISKNCFRDDKEKQILKDKVNIYDSKDTLSLLLSMRINVGCWNKMYKKSAINNLSFDEKQFYGEGLLFISTVAQKIKKSAIFERKIYHYRQDNIASATKKYKFESFVNGEKSLQLIEENLTIKDKNVYKQLYSHFCLFYCNAISSTLKCNKQKEYIITYRYWKKRAKRLLNNIYFNKYINFKTVIKSIILLYFTFIYHIKYRIFK